MPNRYCIRNQLTIPDLRLFLDDTKRIYLTILTSYFLALRPESTDNMFPKVNFNTTERTVYVSYIRGKIKTENILLVSHPLCLAAIAALQSAGPP